MFYNEINKIKKNINYFKKNTYVNKIDNLSATFSEATKNTENDDKTITYVIVNTL